MLFLCILGDKWCCCFSGVAPCRFNRRGVVGSIEECGCVVCHSAKDGLEQHLSDKMASVGYPIAFAIAFDSMYLAEVEHDCYAVVAWLLAFGGHTSLLFVGCLHGYRRLRALQLENKRGACLYDGSTCVIGILVAIDTLVLLQSGLQ